MNNTNENGDWRLLGWIGLGIFSLFDPASIKKEVYDFLFEYLQSIPRDLWKNGQSHFKPDKIFHYDILYEIL